MGTNYVSKVISIAKAEVGYLEKKSSSQLDNKTANAGSANYTKYARDLYNIPGFYNGNKQGIAWCDQFVDWCFVKAYGVTEAKKLIYHNTSGAGCKYSAQGYKNKGRYYTSNPQIGDQIFFNNKSQTFSHTGLVYKVDTSRVYTIEGNTSGASGVVSNGGGVCYKSYPLSYAYINGYGRPMYDKEPASAIAANETISGQSEKTNDFVEKIFKNTSGKVLIVYSDSAFKIKIGTLYANSTCVCIGRINNIAIIRYKVSGSNTYKVGFVNYINGIVN